MEKCLHQGSDPFLVALQKATILGENTTKNINHAEI
jgi:hypothetical protein